jgi:predicted alpha/beta-fold hydrolase
VARWPVSAPVVREVQPTGGHVGFVGPSAAPGLFWAATRALDHLDAALGGGAPER